MKINDLKAEFTRNGLTQKDVANALGITPRTLANKLKTGVFTNKEIDKLKVLLSLESTEFFFDK